MSSPEAHERRPLPTVVAWSLAIGVGAALLTYLLVAAPVYTLASFDPQGLDRPHFRTLLTDVGFTIAGVVGVVAAIAGGRWLRLGRSWTTDQSSGSGS